MDIPCQGIPGLLTRLLCCREEIIAGSVDGTVRRFDVRAGCLFTEDLGQSVTGVALSHDNLCILAACLDSRMRLLDKATGTLLAQYTGAPMRPCLVAEQRLFGFHMASPAAPGLSWQ